MEAKCELKLLEENCHMKRKTLAVFTYIGNIRGS